LGPPDDFEIAWALEIVDAIEQGIFVVFSAGNGSFTIEPQVQGVLAAGGVFMNQGLDLQASDYTSGYLSPWFQNVTVPDISGLVGMRPRAQYIMLPIQPGCRIDIGQSQPAPNDPDDDRTTSNDGWALFSGTSAAAPQIAGVAALILGARPGLTPAQVTEALEMTATDVRVGHCHPRFNSPAGLGRDAATGYGLVNAEAAVQYALTNW
jgi:subtilisin family serine protease